MKVRITAAGTRPLMLHNVRMASPLDSYAKRLKALNAKRIKTDDDRLEIARTEWEGALYFDPDIGPYMPANCVLASLIEGARLTKAGKKVERGVVVNDLVHPLIYKGPRDLTGLWDDGNSSFVDIRPVVVQRNKVDRCRPIFRTWAFESTLLVDPKVIDFEELASVAQAAGELIGIGDYRKMYGRYTVALERL